MAKKHEPGMAYEMKKLHKVFAFFSLILLVSVVWVFLDDYIRPWKAVQIEAMKIEKQKLAEQIEAEEKAISQEKLDILEKQLEEAKKDVAGKNDEISKLNGELNTLLRDLKEETITNGRLNGDVAALGFKWGGAVAHEAPYAPKLFKQLQEKKKLFAASKDRMKTLQGEEKKIRRKIADLEKVVTNTKKEIGNIVGKKELLQGAYDKKKITPIFAVRNAPFLDFLDPTVKIKQVVLENITDDRYFQHVPKVDRCMTCHTFIDKPGYEDQPNPHKTHPKLDLMVGATGKHPMKKFGCTTCHGGEGHRVNDFNAPAHMPATAEQRKEWAEKYHWHEPHKVPIVQFKKGQYEAGCVKCHTDVQYLPGATTLNKGRKSIEKYGCYGCHKIEGWEDKRKPGPSLEKIASKVSKEFFKNWVWDPKAFNKHAKMPAFFGQENNSTPEFTKKNIAEVNAITEFVYAQSEKYKPFMRYTGGNKERGKKLVKEVGCMACHGVADFPIESKKIDAHKGPYLEGLGSKIKSKDWMVSWLKRPSHYQADTIMPSFRLSDREANDITAYLLEGEKSKNKKFESLKFEKMDKAARDEILVTYFSAFDTIDVAKKKLASMTDHERTMELGKRSVGKYGCYSCHSLKGFEGRAPIGPELSKIGSKPLTQFGFSHEYDVEHSRDGWITAHLQRPRRWDNGVDKPFKDLLRMPNFNMSEEEAKEITVALLGQVADKVPLKGVKRLDKHEAAVAEGMKVAVKYNCIGCHQIDGMFGDVLAMYEDDINEGPPRLVGQGHRVQADWFHYFLDNVYPIRPWLKVRMPSFNLTNEERNKLVALFQGKSKMDTFEDVHQKVTWEPGERAAAKKLFKTLDCVSCHAEGYTKDEPTAPNLKYARRRLRPSWIEKWLAGPDQILPGTTMPSFWIDGEAADPEILGGDAKKQIKALTKLLMEEGHNFYSPKHKKTRDNK
ncbi:c-type cytochrome [Bacteriovorax sp. DB6_IX]|uniref:c-type cytochrome n=1 Tax=Bacteriovorax sp. DB6_IX TaxID=1353530 RepID=UPI000389E45C|nr:c-type cytochrome [Bacteriovorax sp. DB6_IX]EQC52675.1 cytochrome C [Bacteriovorax sp. DB6_IX]